MRFQIHLSLRKIRNSKCLPRISDQFSFAELLRRAAGTRITYWNQRCLEERVRWEEILDIFLPSGFHTPFNCPSLQEREGEDEFDNFYRQYRGQSSGYQGGIQENQSVRGFQRVPSEHIGVSGFQRAPSEHSGSISGTSRASLPRSMFGGFGVRQGQGQGSLWGGGSTSGSYASCTSFTTNGYQSQPAPARNPFLGRSRSQGRDPRLTDLFRAGYGRDAEDTLSRDSGCSSANFEESEAYFAPIAGEEVANRGTGSLLSGQRGKGGAQGPVRGIIRQQSFPRESYPSGYYGLGEDSMSLQEGGVRGWDSLSLRSLDSQPLSWSPLSSGLGTLRHMISFLFISSHLLIRVQTTYHCQEEKKHCK